MHYLKINAVADDGAAAEFVFENLGKGRTVRGNGFTLEFGGKMPHKVTVTPPAGRRLRSVAYTLSTALRNFHQVIVPDTGRSYPAQTQLVDFWGRHWPSRLPAVRMPIFLLTGFDLNTELAFGVVGPNVETDFEAVEPSTNRALVAWMKRFTVRIKRGTDRYPLPASVAGANADGSLTEYVYFREPPAKREPWQATLAEFSGHMARLLGRSPRTTADSLLPYWCSWTDWFSDDVTEKVVLDNVAEGRKLGIKNYIIDDGWFGPGLDNDFSVNLNIGDWREDPAKFTDLRSTVVKMHEMGANAVIWCAPHAVAPHARCFAERSRLLIRHKPDELLMTSNKFHSLCFQSPQARRVMADICVDLIRRYDVDGAKYDLFNCVPDAPCCSAEHEHDTASPLEGLAMTMRLIDEETRKLKPDYVVELKQNYATPHLYEYGTIVRAGDTPYNPEGNFLRTAYINAYTPYALNDYQTITNHDSPAAAACLIIKMLAVGVPAYSIDLPALSAAHKRLIRRLHEWYVANLDALRGGRVPLCGNLGAWMAKGKEKDIYFLVNGENRLPIRKLRDCQVLNGTLCGSINLKLPAPAAVSVSPAGGRGKPVRYKRSRELMIPSRPGDILELRFGAK